MARRKSPRRFAGNMKRVFLTGLLALDVFAADRESLHYKIESIPAPYGVVLEAGAIQAMPDGKVAVATRLGDIFMVENALEGPGANAKFTRFASGLHEPLGLTIADGWLYVTQRGEVTRLKDTNADG